MEHREIYDISAFANNVNTVEDCYIVLGIIHGRWRPLPGKIKDISLFETNGYQLFIQQFLRYAML